MKRTLFRRDDMGTLILFIILYGLMADLRRNEDLLMLLLFTFLAGQVDRE